MPLWPMDDAVVLVDAPRSQMERTSASVNPFSLLSRVTESSETRSDSAGTVDSAYLLSSQFWISSLKKCFSWASVQPLFS